MSNRKFDYFDIQNIFIFLSIYFTFIPFMFNISIYSFLTMIIVVIGIFSFYYGYKTKKYFLIVGKRGVPSRNKFIYIIGILLLFNDMINGFQNLFSIKIIESYASSFEVKDSTNLYIQIVILLKFAIKYYIYAILMSRSKVLFYIIFISQVMLFFNSSVRLIALSPFVIFIIYGYYMDYIKVNKTRILMLLSFMPFSFVILLLSRAQTEGMNYFLVILNVYNKLTFESFFNILTTALESFQSFYNLTNIITSNLVHIESGVVRILFTPISRGIWIDKPEPQSRIIAQEFSPAAYENHGGMVATIFGDTFVNGHVLGVVILMFLLGRVSKIIYNTVHNTNNINIKQKSVLIVFYSLYIFQFLYYMRGFFSDLLWKMLLITLVFYILYKIQFSTKALI